MGDLAHKAEVGLGIAAAVDRVAVHAAKPDAAPFEQRDKVFVDLAGQHLLHNPHRLGVGVAQAVDKPGFNAELFEHRIDGRPAAVHHNHPHAEQRQGDKVVHNGELELAVDHCVAAVFDDEGFAVVFLDIRRRFGKKLRHLDVLHRFPSLLPIRCGSRR